MRILNASTHYANALVVSQQRGEALLPVQARGTGQGATSLRAAAPREVGKYPANRDQLESMIRGFEESRATAARNTRYDAEMLHGRARQALEAYRLQQDQPQREAESVLRQMMGIDYYV